MFEIIVFAFTIMYTPGPVNFIALFAGVNNQGWQALRFCLGVGLAMYLLFLIKGLVVILPITTVLLPQADITGNAVPIWSMILASMACGAPSLYLLIGSKMKRVATDPKPMNWLNRLMALLLLIVAVDFIF